MRPSLGIALIVVLTGIAIAAMAKIRGAHTERGMREVAQLTEKVKTVCLGRLLLDMPREANVELARARIHGFDIAAFEESMGEFQRRLAQRAEEIKSSPDRLGGNKNLELVKDVKAETGLVGKIFVHGRTVTQGTAGNGFENESYRYEGVAVEALVHGNGVSIDLGSGYYSPDRIENLYRLVSQLVPNPGNALPPEPGFCIDHAYFRDPLRAE
jgi:hypothetical protein